MSVSKRKGSKFYNYEFKWNGKRYRGSTEQTNRRKAEKFEERAKAAVAKAKPKTTTTGIIAAAVVEPIVSPLIELPLAVALMQFWKLKVSKEAGHKTAAGQIKRLVAHFGQDRIVSTIDTTALVDYREKRSADAGPSGKPLAARTVNGDIELFRRMLAYLRSLTSDAKKDKPNLGEERNWKLIRRSVPKGRVRCLSPKEEEDLFAALRTDYHDIIRFAIMSGLRREALLLRWEDVNLDVKEIRVRRKIVRDSPDEESFDIIPISESMCEILKAQRDKSGKPFNQEWVWTYVAKRPFMRDRTAGTTHRRTVGDRHPITYNGLGTVLSRAAKNAGLKDWRTIHDFRHTAATRTLRASLNLAAVQKLLTHRDIGSTMRYAHIMNDDVRDALEAASPHKVPTAAAREAMAEDFGF